MSNITEMYIVINEKWLQWLQWWQWSMEREYMGYNSLFTSPLRIFQHPTFWWLVDSVLVGLIWFCFGKGNNWHISWTKKTTTFSDLKFYPIQFCGEKALWKIKLYLKYFLVNWMLLTCFASVFYKFFIETLCHDKVLDLNI